MTTPNPPQPSAVRTLHERVLVRKLLPILERTIRGGLPVPETRIADMLALIRAERADERERCKAMAECCDTGHCSYCDEHCCAGEIRDAIDALPDVEEPS